MKKEIEKIIKIQNKLNKRNFHLGVETDLEEKTRWSLYLNFRDFDKYMSNDNRAIMESEIDSLDDLINYLEKHEGFRKSAFDWD